jgi:hypothetical protein
MTEYNKYWKEDTCPYTGRTRRYRVDDKDYIEYHLDKEIAERIKQLRLRGCTWRTLAIEVTGFEDQMTGKDLIKLAAWTLGEDEHDWDK